MPVYIAILIFSVIVSYIGMNQFASSNPEPRYNRFGTEMNISKGYAFLAFGLIIFFAAMRYEFVDSSSYINEFNLMLPTGWGAAVNALKNQGKAPLFVFVNILFKTYISDNYLIWFLVYALFHTYAMVKLFYTLSCDYTYTVFLFITSTSFTWLFNAMKQMTAMAIIYLAISYVIERKFLKFLLAIFIAYLFHQTVLIWVPIYFFATDKPWGKRTALFIFGTVSAVLFLSSFTDLLGSALEDTAYASATNTFSKDNGVNPIRVIVSAVPAVIAFIRKNELEPYLTPAVNLCINLTIIATCVYFVGVFTDGITVGRLPVYFSFCSWPLFPWLFKYGFSESDGKTVKLACTVGYLGFFIYNLLFAGLDVYGSKKLDLWYNVSYMQ